MFVKYYSSGPIEFKHVLTDRCVAMSKYEATLDFDNGGQIQTIKFVVFNMND